MLFASVVMVFALVSLLGLVGIAVSDSAFTRLKKRFFCPWEEREVEVEFIPKLDGLMGRRSGDVYSCTAFKDKYDIACERMCEESEYVRKIPAMIEQPAIQYTNP